MIHPDERVPSLTPHPSRPTSSIAVIVAGGDTLARSVLEEIPQGAWVVAADSGLDHALALGIPVDYLVGDLDSVSSTALEALDGVPVERHRPDKDATDLDLALRVVASREEIERVVVVGGHGGRLDHLLANASVLASPRWSHLAIQWVAGSSLVHVVHDHVELHGTPGDLVSLVPMGGPAEGVRSEGLRWQLVGDRLEAGTSRGVSNELVRPVASVRLMEGTLLAVQPDAVPERG